MKRWPIYTIAFVGVWAAKHYWGWKLEVDNSILEGTLWTLLAVFITWIVLWVLFVLRKN